MQTIFTQTIKAYLEDTYCFVGQGEVIHAGMDDKGHFFILDKTIFYPQGGGQPSDQGYLEIEGTRFDVSHVRMIDNQIRHYSTHDCKELIGTKPQLIIDQEKRLLHAKLHTSGHLISNIIEREYPKYKAIKGHHFPGECYVEFSVNDQLDNDQFSNGQLSNGQLPQELDLAYLNNAINDAIEKDLRLESIYIQGNELSRYCPNLPYSIPKTDNVRLIKMSPIKMSPFYYQPCGGTHVKSSLELKGLYLTKQKLKSNEKLKSNSLKISYEII